MPEIYHHIVCQKFKMLPLEGSKELSFVPLSFTCRCQQYEMLFSCLWLHWNPHSVTLSSSSMVWAAVLYF